MSAWLCGNMTLSCCVDIIKSKEFEFYDDGTYSNLSNEELMSILSNLNTDSLNCRYGISTEHILKNKEYFKLDVSDAQKHKSVRCYLYQTCECAETREHPLFDALEQWSNDVYEKYENAHQECEWDLDRSVYNGKFELL